MRRMGWAAAALATAATAIGVAAGPAAAAAPAGGLPVVYNGLTGLAHLSATASPPGANDWSCTPTSEHPRPVVLVHGTFLDMDNDWQALSPLLVDHGYCVYALNYGQDPVESALGVDGTGSIAASAQQLSTFIDKVLAATGAGQVDIVGHSQGGMMPRYYIKELGGASKVHTLVGLAPSNHGTTLDGLFTILDKLPGFSLGLSIPCTACTEQEAGSSFMTALNAGGDTVPGIDYTVIESRNDEVVTPYTSAFLSGRNVTDITLQNQCPLDQGEHLSMPYDHIADADVLTALDPADPVTAPCTPVLPVIGG